MWPQVLQEALVPSFLTLTSDLRSVCLSLGLAGLPAEHELVDVACSLGLARLPAELKLLELDRSLGVCTLLAECELLVESLPQVLHLGGVGGVSAQHGGDGDHVHSLRLDLILRASDLPAPPLALYSAAMSLQMLTAGWWSFIPPPASRETLAGSSAAS